MRGFNVAAIFLGESGAGRTATLTGRHGEEEGFLNMLIADIFASLDDDKAFSSESHKKLQTNEAARISTGAWP